MRINGEGGGLKLPQRAANTQELPKLKLGEEAKKPSTGTKLPSDSLPPASRPGKVSKLELPPTKPQKPPEEDQPLTPKEELFKLDGEQSKLFGTVTRNAEGSPTPEKWKKKALELQQQYNEASDKGDLEACKKIHEQMIKLAKDLNKEFHDATGMYWGDMPHH